MSTSTRVQRIKRHRRVRKRVQGSPERPRLAVFRSNRHLYAQIIDDLGGQTLASASTLDPQIRTADLGPGDAAAAVGRLVAERGVDRGVRSVVFDRGGFLYHGQVKALADGAREKGLEL